MTNNGKFILDNNVLIEINKAIKDGRISLTDIQKLTSFFELFVVSEVPYKLRDEYRKNGDAGFTDSQNTTMTVNVVEGEVYTNYSFSGNMAYGCKEIRVKEKDESGNWKDLKPIQDTDVEIIVSCVKNNYQFVTSDKSAASLAISLGVNVSTLKSFLVKMDVNLNK